METVIRQKRIESGVSLRELARAMGAGFSRSRLSLVELGLVQIPPYQDQAILEAIARLAPICANGRKIIELAKDLDLRPFVRESHCAA